MKTKRNLTDYKRAVLTTITMRLSRREALAYLQAEGYPISNATLGRIKSEIKRNSSRMHQVAAYEFHQQHLARIDNCELIAKLMWQEYLRERSPYRRVLILKEIKELQPYLSSYYEATKMVLGSKYGYGLEDSSTQLQQQRSEPESQSWASTNPSSNSNSSEDSDRGKIPPVR